MSTNSKKPRRRTARAWARLVEAWKKSGQSANEFAAARGVVARTLTWWRWRLATTPLPTTPPPLRLVPLEIAPSSSSIATPAPSPPSGPAWEIVTARGHVLRVHRAIADGELRAVLAALDLTQERR